MKIDSIFEVVKGSLYSVKYSDDNEDEFTNIFDKWADAEFLTDFFVNHLDDLQSGFYGEIDIEKAVDRTVEEAKRLGEKLLELSKSGQTDDYNTLQALFKPLNTNEYRLTDHQKSKAYGSERKSWLRVYAIRVSKNCFFVSGVSIKLTENMKPKHLQKELRKLEMTKQYLIDEGILDEDDLEYLEI